MSGRLWSVRSHGLLNPASRPLCGFLCLVCLAASAHAQERREREPNSVYTERRAKLAAQADGPIVLWGFTGREEVSDRKSTRLNSSHRCISYAVFCLKKK